MNQLALKDYLDQKYLKYNNTSFILNDPISIPHRFSKKQDIEISGFWMAVLAWGQRKTIINKGVELMHLMDNAPFDFVTNHSDRDLKRLIEFKHRTFNSTDTLYFIDFFKRFYQRHQSLEEAFITGDARDHDMKTILSRFHKFFFDSEYAPGRTRKHVATPDRNSACKRINMFLRWMVRKDVYGVDFGLWDKIKSSQLICPCDVHVERTARRLGLVKRKQTDWKMAVELTENLRKFDQEDPVKYDFALFGLSGIN
ncbi:MAG: TIGR02757 family protein [Cyclobacteriaceae bacterium]|nr:MAG: TIGR02757 family protein [Cyclobacteriaceae bacterium]